MQQLIIRQATAADTEAIIQLNEQLFANDSAFDDTLNLSFPGSKEGLDYFRRRASGDEGVAYIAMSGTRIVGYLAGAIGAAAPYRRLKLVGELENMLVVPDMRGAGIGKKLVEAFASYCRQGGAERVQVVASASNKKAVAFYLREGFKDYNLVLEREP